eukprot:m.202995 g.202995  ORF g.202995 m.202995 type:complete len:960 (-) comp32843_c0_seq1:72-2951(-)
MDFAFGVKDRILSEFEVAFLHLGHVGEGFSSYSILGWLRFQYQLTTLLRLEAFHRCDARRQERLALEGQEALAGGLPHVDTGVKNGQSFFQNLHRLFNTVIYPFGLCTLNSAAAKSAEMMKMLKMEAADQSPPPILKQLVMIGGGHSHAFLIKNLGMKPLEGVEVTLITRDLDTPYSGMLPGYVAGEYTRDECHIDLVRLGNFAKARIVHAEACAIDSETKMISLTDGRPPIPYDIVSINIGSSPKLSSQPTAKRFTITPVKPIDGFARRWEEILARTVQEATGKRGVINFVVVGAGAGGVELCLCMHARLGRELRALGRNPDDCIKFTLIGRNKVVMPAHAKETQDTFLQLLKARGITTELGVYATNNANDDTATLALSDGRVLEVDECIWCTQASAQPWLTTAGIDLDAGGFIKVNKFMQSSDPSIFAAGDIACLEDPRPKAGVFAVRAGPPLTANIRSLLLDDETLMVPFLPQKTFLGIIGTGETQLAVASKGNMAVGGAWLWLLKDWIDRKWMAEYTSGLPDMAKKMEEARDARGALAFPEIARAAYARGEKTNADEATDMLDALKHASMRCGGCGAKVGATTLSRAMKQVAPLVHQRSDVLVGLDMPDDCALVNVPTALDDPVNVNERAELVLVHTVDFFRTFISDPYVFGQIAANHALSDCHAMCAEAHTALAVAVLPFAVANVTESTMVHMMAGACKALAESNCALVGGHTCEGSKLALGFAINGVADTNRVLYKGIPKSRCEFPKIGDEDGFAIVITKPVGTGTIFAADMRMKARARWVGGAINSMLKSNRVAGLTFRDHDAVAATDVTGFGVLGHLVEMIKASNDGLKEIDANVEETFAAYVDLDHYPVLEGALECIQGGIASSLQPDNLRMRRAITNEREAMTHAKYPLLFDPQTAGGILAFVPFKTVDACVKTLRSQGYETTVVMGSIKKEKQSNDVESHQVVTVIQK